MITFMCLILFSLIIIESVLILNNQYSLSLNLLINKHKISNSPIFIG